MRKTHVLILGILVVAMMSTGWASSTRMTFWMAVATFILSFAFRTADASVCPTLPYGTHFLWHIFNAVTVYLLARVAIVSKALD